MGKHKNATNEYNEDIMIQIWNLSNISYTNEVERKNIIYSNAVGLLTATSIFTTGYALLLFEVFTSDKLHQKTLILLGTLTILSCVVSLFISVLIFKDHNKSYLPSPNKIYLDIYNTLNTDSNTIDIYREMIATLDYIYISLDKENNKKKKFLNISVEILKLAMILAVLSILTAFVVKNI